MAESGEDLADAYQTVTLSEALSTTLSGGQALRLRRTSTLSMCSSEGPIQEPNSPSSECSEWMQRDRECESLTCFRYAQAPRHSRAPPHLPSAALVSCGVDQEPPQRSGTL